MIHPIDRPLSGYLPIGAPMDMMDDRAVWSARTHALRIAIIAIIGMIDVPTSIAQNWRITTTPAQLIFLEFPIDLLHVPGGHGIGLHAAYRPALIGSGTIPGHGPYHLQNYWNFGLKSFTIGIFHRYALRDRYGLHIEQRLLFRQWQADRTTTHYSGGNDPVEGLRNERQDVFILKLLIGKDIAWHRRKGPSHVMEIFSGVSIRLKQLDREMSGTDQRQDEDFWLPAVHVGLRWGFGWQSK